MSDIETKTETDKERKKQSETNSLLASARANQSHRRQRTSASVCLRHEQLVLMRYSQFVENKIARNMRLLHFAALFDIA